MSNEDAVAQNYAHGDLLRAIEAALSRLGKTVDSITVSDLAAVDEFHIGGRVATERLLDQLKVSADTHCLDVGCGLGGASRFVASTYNNRVTGIDLTREFIDTGRVLSSWVKLNDKVTLEQGSALSMPFPDQAFDGAYMMHVGMNIEDKHRLFAEVYRVLRPGSYFGIYDIMRFSDADLELIDGALERASPDIADSVDSVCPTCSAEIAAKIDPLDFAFPKFGGVITEIHLLAQAYHWNEDVILALPIHRRRAYVDLIRESMGVQNLARVSGRSQERLM